MIFSRVRRTTNLEAFSKACECILIFIIGGLNAKTIHVAPSGKSGNDGTSFLKAYDFNTALGKASAGDSILLQGGTYTIPYNSNAKNTISISISGTSSNWINIVAEKGKRATFDFSYPDNSKVLNNSITSYGFYFETSSRYLYLNGISVTRAGYQGAYVTGKNIAFENCHFFKNWNSGLEVNNGGSYVTLLNCDSYSNYDGKYKNGGMADGFAIKQEMGPGNMAIGCRAWDNSDDGYDTFDSPEFVIFENCWAFKNGYDQGNGNGFKVGGSGSKDVGQKNILKNCIAFENVVKGFDQNSNTAGITLYNCTSFKNGINYGFGGTVKDGRHVFKNCISLSGKSSDSFGNSDQSNNSWNSGLSANSSDFESLDLALATEARNPDGSLPITKLFRLKSTSKLINAGVDVGIKVKDGKPDVGAFEYEELLPVDLKGSGFKITNNFSQSIQMERLVISLSSFVKYARVNVYSLDGLRVLSGTILEDDGFSIDCSHLRSGSYITQLDMDGGKQKMRFTKFRANN